MTHCFTFILQYLCFQLLKGILFTQATFLASQKISIDETDIVDPVFTLCEEILEKLPELFDIDAVSETYPIVYTDSMNTVLRQELIRQVF